MELGTWTIPPVIPYVCRAARLNETEALKTFNCGLGMILLVDPQSAEAVKSTLEAAGETVFEVGRVVPGEGVVRYENEGSLFAGEEE